MTASSVPSWIVTVSELVRSHTAGLWSTIGVVVGLGLSAAGNAQAAVAVASSPELADARFSHAIVANHTGDWLFYHYPVVMTLIMAVVWGAIGFGVGLKR